jgi:hypothetical protein
VTDLDPNIPRALRDICPRPGQIWEWEPLEPRNRETVRVTRVWWDGDEVQVESESVQGGRRVANDLGRWIEATVYLREDEPEMDPAVWAKLTGLPVTAVHRHGEQILLSVEPSPRMPYRSTGAVYQFNPDAATLAVAIIPEEPPLGSLLRFPADPALSFPASRADMDITYDPNALAAPVWTDPPDLNGGD